jgi:hypothetical protein
MSERGHNLAIATDVITNTSKVVEYILRLELTSARWSRVAGIIEAAIAAAQAGDLEGVQNARHELVLTSPARVIKPDGSPTTVVGQQIIERANVLIHTLQSMQPTPTPPVPSPAGEATANDRNVR